MTRSRGFQIGIAVLIGILLLAFMARKTIMIDIDGSVQTFTTFAPTVRGALASAGIVLHQQDQVSPDLPALVGEGDQIVVTSAVPVLVIGPNGDHHMLFTAERDPDSWLAQAGYSGFSSNQLLINGIAYTGVLPDAHSYLVEWYGSRTVTFNSEVLTLPIEFRTVGEFISAQEIPLTASDQIIPSPDTLLVDQLVITSQVSHALTIIVDGQQLEVRASGETVGEALTAAGVSLQGLDYSLPREGKPIPEDRVIRVVRVQESVSIEQELLPFETQFQPLPEVDIDTYSVAQAGEYGLRAQRVRVRVEDGEEISRVVEDQWVARQPQPRIEGYGTKITIRTLQTADGTIEYWRAVDVYATSYSASRAGTPVTAPNYGITYSGAVLKKGHIAVLRSWYPSMAGRSFYVPGYGFGTIADIGGGISGRRWIDLGFEDDTYEQWNHWTTLYFLTPVPPDDQILWVLP